MTSSKRSKWQKFAYHIFTCTISSLLSPCQKIMTIMMMVTGNFACENTLAKFNWCHCYTSAKTIVFFT